MSAKFKASSETDYNTAVGNLPKLPGRIWDERFPGLCLEVTRNGFESWKYTYRDTYRRVRWYTLGSRRRMPVKDARKAARSIAARVDNGEDPQAEKVGHKAKAQKKPQTLDYIAERYFATNPNDARASTLDYYRQHFKRHIQPAFGKKLATELTTADWQDFFMDLKARLPGTVGPVLAFASAMMGFAARSASFDLSTNPVRDVDIKIPKSREKVPLSPEELRRFWRGLRAVAMPYRAMFVAMLFTGQRQDEVATMCWADIDGPWWTQRANKRGETHTVYLPQTVREMLRQVPLRDDGYVFCGKISQTAKDRLKIASGLVERSTPFTPHLLRHQAASELSHLVPDATVSKVLNHAEGGTTKRYQHHSLNSEKREATQALERRLHVLLGHGPWIGEVSVARDNVVQMSQKFHDSIGVFAG